MTGAGVSLANLFLTSIGDGVVDLRSGSETLLISGTAISAINLTADGFLFA